MKKIKCYLFGHTKTDYNDSVFHVCERCNSHEYYDYPSHWTKNAFLLKPIWFIKRKYYQIKDWFNRSALPF